MTTSIPAKQPVMNGQGGHHVQTGIAEAFVRILSHLYADKDCQEITNLVSEMDALRVRNEMLLGEIEKGKIAGKENFATIQQVMNDNQELDLRRSQQDAELEKAQRRASEADEKLSQALESVTKLEMELDTNVKEIDKVMTNQKEKDSQIESLNKKVAELQKSAKKAQEDLKEAHEMERAQAKKRYEVVSQELDSLRKRVVPLKKTSESAFSDLRKQLRGLAEEVFRLVHHFCGQLQLDSLVAEGWQKFTTHPSLFHIPLPRSNSEAARQMRVAAVLRLVAEMARDYIFHPVYLTEDGVEVAKIIDELGSSEASWVRSVLLNIGTKEQGANGMKRAEIASGKIVELVRFMMPSPASSQEFQTAVSQWYQKAAKLWMSLQQLELRIECQLGVQVGEQGLPGWKAFPEPPPPKDKQPAGGSQNGTTPKPEDKTRLAIDNVALEVWPRFLATKDDEHSGILVSGSVLLNTQTVTASHELIAASLDRGGGSHRVTRGRQRPVLPVNVGANGSTEDLSFLSQKA